jgi:hypothetical protein
MTSFGSRRFSRSLGTTFRCGRNHGRQPLLRLGVHVDLLRIDGEGFDDGALRGMSTALEESQLRIIFECLRQELALKVSAALADWGFVREPGIVSEPKGRNRSEQTPFIFDLG